VKAVEVLDAQISQAEFAEIIGVSQARVSQMVADGLLIRGDTALEWISAYCDNLREIAAGRAAGGGLDLATERARLAAEQADRISMQNAQTRSELAPVSLIEQVLVNAASRIVGILDAIPGAVRRRLPQLSAADIEMVGAEVAKARNTVASMSLDDLRQAEAPGEQDQDEPAAVVLEESGSGSF